MREENTVLFDLSHNFTVKIFTKVKNKLNGKNKQYIMLHALHHTHCNYLLSKDISIKYTGKRLGHSSIGTTISTYAHKYLITFNSMSKIEKPFKSTF